MLWPLLESFLAIGSRKSCEVWDPCPPGSPEMLTLAHLGLPKEARSRAAGPSSARRRASAAQAGGARGRASYRQFYVLWIVGWY